jgi:hypothetical protein
MVVRCVGALLALAPLAACGGGDSIADVQVQSATLSNITWVSAGLVLGVSNMSGSLTVVDTEGVTHPPVSVELVGPDLGLVANVTAASFYAEATLTLPHPLLGSQLMGTYRGGEVNGTVLVGVEYYGLTNSAGATLSSVNVGLGVGIYLGVNWLTLSTTN